MASQAARQAVEPERLGAYLKALASPTRIRILAELRTPKPAAEIEVPAEQDRPGLSDERTLSRPSVVHHLDVLEEAGLVERVNERERSAYAVNQQVLFSVVHELSALAKLRSDVEVDVGRTRPVTDEDATTFPSGPRLVLVGGPRDGEASPLAGEGPWHVGRGEGNDLRLGYDPYVSETQLIVHRTPGGGFLVETVAGVRNPTLVNGETIEPGTTVGLTDNAVIAIGCSRLVFQTS